MGIAFKWTACYSVLTILFVTWIVSYMDRMVMSVAIPYIAIDYDLSPLAMGAVMSAFFAGYSISQIPGGLLADCFGVRRVATIAMLWWSVCTAITGAAANLNQMLIVRFVFGLGEGVFPACAFKTVALWFPKEKRATATAIMLASNSLGAALAPLALVGILSLWGWRTAFYGLCLPGVLIALLFWQFIPDQPSESSRAAPAEVIEIEESGGGAQNSSAKVSLVDTLKAPNVLKYFFILLTFDAAYWGFTTWLPTYLVKARGFSMFQMGVAASLPFFAGTVGCILGGWLSDKYFRNNRRIPIVATQLMSAILLYLTVAANSAFMMVICQTLAGFFLTLFFSVFWALPMNTVAEKSIGVTSGFINMGGLTAAFISPMCVGYLVGAAGGNFDHTFTFLIVSLLSSSAIVFTLPGELQQYKEEPNHS
jgi:sugar phosphate permease